jgi:hypothetical protein
MKCGFSRAQSEKVYGGPAVEAPASVGYGKEVSGDASACRGFAVRGGGAVRDRRWVMSRIRDVARLVGVERTDGRDRATRR